VHSAHHYKFLCYCTMVSYFRIVIWWHRSTKLPFNQELITTVEPPN
jgi:hypothetical protein